MLKGLNPNQKEAVFSSNGPLLIVAGAGTGKTKTLTSRLIYLLENGVSPKNICALTFTNKAAKEMSDRVLKVLQERKLNDLFIGTFHSLGLKILRVESPVFGRDKNFIIFDDNDSFSLIKNIVKNLKIKDSPSSILNSISKIKSGSIQFEEFLESNDEKQNLILEVFKKYESELEKQNAFDFDDLILKVVLLFQQNKNVLEKYQNKFQYILVDEYQDLNNAQYEMIKLLAQKFKNLNVVGDDAQTIYSWRGSNIEIFLNFERDWPNSKIVFLEENYRSTQNILNAAQAVISKNIYQKQKNLKTQNEPGELIKITETENEESEALYVVNAIKKIIQEKKHKSIGILYRINAQSRAIEQVLNLESIPYKIFGGIRFYDRKEIKDVLAGLRFIYNSKDNISFERIKKTFNQKVLNNFLEKIKTNTNKNPVELINLFLNITNYFNYLEKNFSNFKERIENIEELIHFASNFNNLEEFLERIALIQPHDNEKNKNAFLELMTIHLAKGLEFDCVFILGVSEGILPHKLSYYNNKEMEEERRLMYVAMTRAKKELFISYYKEPSRFLFDIPQNLVAFQSFVSNETELIDDELNYIHY